MPPAIAVKDLVKKFTQTTAVDGLSFSVERGEIFGLVGPDGAGKTTTMRILVGVMSPSSGTAEVAGFDVVRQAEEIKKRIGYMSQKFSLYGELSVQENLDFFADLYLVSEPEKAERQKRLLHFSKLGPFVDRQARHLSGGMKQKLGLSCALIHTPEILFLDEPTTGVDPVSRRELWEIVYDLLEENVTVFVSTPYMDEAERCSRVAFIHKGKILALDDPKQLKATGDREVFEVKVENPRQWREGLEGLPGLLELEIFGDKLHLSFAKGEMEERGLGELLARKGAEADSVRRIVPSLEDLFISLVKSRAANG
ncbi:MAG: ABC transporter ATP-binding protein [candidate division Zixibacteria bacterium]|nr:ABC transporter ATP-binding protein [candidate division Zixibacteria bacterium]